MLHPNAKNRLMDVCPAEVECSWIHPIKGVEVSETVHPDVRWKAQDIPIEYPVISMELSPETVPRHTFGAREGDDTYVYEREDDDTIAYEVYIGTPVTAQLHITVAVASSHGDIPAHMVADEIANEVWYQYEYNTEHLNTQGENELGEPIDYEWPMSVHAPDGAGIRNMNRVIDKQNVQRRALEFEVRYRWWRYEEVPATQALDVEYTLLDQAENEISNFREMVGLQYGYGWSYGTDYGLGTEDA